MTQSCPSLLTLTLLALEKQSNVLSHERAVYTLCVSMHIHRRMLTCGKYTAGSGDFIKFFLFTTTQHIKFFYTLVYVTFDPTAYTVKEGVDTHAKLLLVRSGDLSHETSVTITPIAGTALGENLIVIQYSFQTFCNNCYTAVTDFESSQLHVTFFSGETNAEALVAIIDDSVYEETETFTAIMTTSHTNVVIGEDTAVVTILDNDREFICNS